MSRPLHTLVELGRQGEFEQGKGAHAVMQSASSGGVDLGEWQMSRHAGHLRQKTSVQSRLEKVNAHYE